MQQVLLFSLIGLGAGSVYALLALGLAVEQQGSGVVNFAHGAVAMYCAYCYSELRSNGHLILPVVGLPHEIPISTSPLGTWPAVVLTVAYGAGLGALLQWLIFSRLRTAPTLAKVVASIGLMLTLQAMAVINFGTATRTTPDILPASPVTIFGATIGQDRLWLTGITVVIALAIAAVYRFTRFGVVTRAAAQNRRASTLLGWHPGRFEVASWAIASAVAALVGVLAAPITTLTPSTLTLAVVPALAAALMARFTSIPVAVATGLLIGIGQSLCVWAAASWAWFPQQGMSDALPFIVIAAAMLLRGKGVVTRGELQDARLPRATQPRRPYLSVLLLVPVFAVLLLVTHAGWRAAVIESLVTAALCLSLTLLTGFVGQVSLVQAAFAGVGGFMLAKTLAHHGLPFPVALIVAGLAAVPLGLIIGIPALRIRGINLAIITLGAAVALDSLFFNNVSVSGGLSGTSVPPPHLFGLNLGIRGTRQGDFPTVAFGLLALGVFVLLAILITNLRRSPTGYQMLAVRGNEPAAAALGINVVGTKLLAFALSAFVAGVAGGLMGFQQGQLSPASFSVFVSITLLAIAYIGGIATVSGAIVAGVLLAPGGLGFTALDRWLSLGAYEPLVAGVGVVVSTMANPDGLATAFGRLRRSRTAPLRDPASERVPVSAMSVEGVGSEPALGH